MRWFGEDWGAPVCHAIDHIETPVDLQCIYCPRVIDEGDAGFEMPHLYEGGITVVYAHRDCLLRAILPREALRSVPPV